MLILLIESSTSICSVALSRDGKIIASREINEQSRHAELLTVFIEEVVKECNITFKDLDAVAVSKGPGSYTGLRIGVSAAKGICYALEIPLIAIGTLEAMAQGMIPEAKEGDLLIPMIDARRMEVYTAIYDYEGNEIKEVSPMVLDEKSFIEYTKNPNYAKMASLGNQEPKTKNQEPRTKNHFSGDGMPKAKELLSKIPNAIFTEAGNCSAKHLMIPSEKKFLAKDFEDVAYFEPFYLKTFHPGPKRSEG